MRSPWSIPSATKLSRDIGWGLASFAVLGIAGIAINAIIGRMYDPQALGVFNQVLAIYTLLSQPAAFGLHLSVLKHLPAASQDPDVQSGILYSALIPTLLTAAFVTALAGFMGDLLGTLLDSPALAASWIYAVPGLFFFSLNKVYLSALNALGRMRAFALGQMTRYGLLMFAVVGVAISDTAVAYLSLAITLSEFGLCVGLAIYMRAALGRGRMSVQPEWLRTHWQFGSRAWLSGSVTDLNQRADILLLGYFLSDQAVGIYSFASTLVDGFVQLAVAVRQAVNPTLARLYALADRSELQAFARQIVRRTYLVFLPASFLAVGLFPWVGRLLTGTDAFSSQAVFALLMLGFVIRSGYIPINMIFLQTGHPGHQTLFMAITAGAKIMFGLVLIASFGLWGAATAVCLAQAASVVYFRAVAARVLRLRI